MNENSLTHLTVPSLSVLPMKAHPPHRLIAGGCPIEGSQTVADYSGSSGVFSYGVCLGPVLRSYSIPGCLFLTCVCAFCVRIITSPPLTLYPLNNNCCVELWSLFSPCPLHSMLRCVWGGGTVILSFTPCAFVCQCGVWVCVCVCVYWADLCVQWDLHSDNVCVFY